MYLIVYLTLEYLVSSLPETQNHKKGKEREWDTKVKEKPI